MKECRVLVQGCFLLLFHVQVDLTEGLDIDKNRQSLLFGRLSAEKDKAASDRLIYLQLDTGKKKATVLTELWLNAVNNAESWFGWNADWWATDKDCDAFSLVVLEIEGKTSKKGIGELNCQVLRIIWNFLSY